VGYGITQLHGTAKEYVVMIAAYGIIDHTLNYAQQTIKSYKNQTYNCYVVQFTSEEPVLTEERQHPLIPII
jgi:hypothetical protein